MKSEIFEVTGDYLKADRALYAGLLGVAIVTVVQLLAVSTPDLALTISICAFALAIPLLCFSLYQVMQEEQHPNTIDPGYAASANCFGAIVAALGFVVLFFHFSPAIGVLFVASAIYSFVCSWRFYNELEQANRPGGLEGAPDPLSHQTH